MIGRTTLKLNMLSRPFLVIISLVCFIVGCKRGTESKPETPSVRSLPLKSSLSSAEMETLDEHESIYRLYRKTEAGKRLVTEAYVCHDGIDTLLPTPFGWGCVIRGMAGSSEVLAP